MIFNGARGGIRTPKGLHPLDPKSFCGRGTGPRTPSNPRQTLASAYHAFGPSWAPSAGLLRQNSDREPRGDEFAGLGPSGPPKGPPSAGAPRLRPAAAQPRREARRRAPPPPGGGGDKSRGKEDRPLPAARARRSRPRPPARPSLRPRADRPRMMRGRIAIPGRRIAEGLRRPPDHLTVLDPRLGSPGGPRRRRSPPDMGSERT